jgi:hypothetical protein
MLQCPWPTTVVPVRINETETELSVSDFGRGNQVNVHNIVLGKCVEFIYVVVSDSDKL